MLDSIDLIEQALQIAGEELEFTNLGITIYGIPGTNLYSVPGYDSIFDLQKQEFSFIVAEKSIKDNSIAIKDQFSYAVESSKVVYTFEIIAIYTDLTGWMKLVTKYISNDSN